MIGDKQAVLCKKNGVYLAQRMIMSHVYGGLGGKNVREESAKDSSMLLAHECRNSMDMRFVGVQLFAELNL